MSLIHRGLLGLRASRARVASRVKLLLVAAPAEGISSVAASLLPPMREGEARMLQRCGSKLGGSTQSTITPRDRAGIQSVRGSWAACRAQSASRYSRKASQNSQNVGSEGKLIGADKKLPGRCTQGEGRVCLLCGLGLRWARRMQRRTEGSARRDGMCKSNAGCLARPLGGALFPGMGTPPGCPKRVCFRTRFMPQFFRKPVYTLTL
jgi:hypothetical protein